jgi:hypothetical protein
MSEEISLLAGLSYENKVAKVSVTIGTTNVIMGTAVAKNFVRQILLCIDDAEGFNKIHREVQEVNDE